MASSSSSSSSSSPETETLTLIPGLPFDLSALILSYIPLPFHGRLKSISKSWHTFFSSQSSIFTLRQLHVPPSKLSHLLCLFPQDPSITSPYLFDPLHLAWSTLPPMPINPNLYSLCNFSAVSIGPHIYVIGGSLFDTRSFPLDRPCPSSAVFRFDFGTLRWDSMSPMITPRGSFACAVVGGGRGDKMEIMVAGGGSRHAMFGAAGSRVRGSERYDVERDEWVEIEGLPGFRAGCVGFCVGGREFWVMGGYGKSRTISGVLPVDEYYRDVVVMDFDEGRWREVGNMWEEMETRRLGKIVVVDHDGDVKKVPDIFMLDGNTIFRYNMALNNWHKESTIPRQAEDESRFGFVALQGELNVISLMQGVELSEIRRSRHRRRGNVLFMQIYNPVKKLWRSLVTRTPFHGPLDFRTAVMCTMRV